MNNRYEIEGGLPVSGELQCYGAKNFATKALVASLLTTEKSRLLNVPPISDVDITIDMLTSIGVMVEYDKNKREIEIDPSKISSTVVSMPDSGSNRIPILLLTPLLHRFGNAEVPVLGGCKIGARNIDFHINAVKKYGAEVMSNKDGYKAKTDKRLVGTQIDLPFPSVGATETCLLLGVLSKGTSVINNAALEPEVLELITMLRSMGAIVFTTPGRKIIIDGVEKMYGTTMEILGDRIEAASWACLACATNGSITVRGVNPNNLGNFLSYFMQVGGGYNMIDSNTLVFFRKNRLKSTMIETDVYPGFSTDWQQPFAILLTQAEGVSIIHETVYENRFGYLEALNKMGAKTMVSNYCLGRECRFANKGYPHSAIITGPTKLISSGELMVPDLRAGLAYVIAAALASGTTTLHGIENIERGYGDISVRLANLINIKKLCD